MVDDVDSVGVEGKGVVTEAGYDYLLIRGRLHRRFFNFSGLFVVVLGAMPLASSGAYYAYAGAGFKN